MALESYLSSCIPEFNKRILSTYHKQISVLGQGNKPTNKSNLALVKLRFIFGDKANTVQGKSSVTKQNRSSTGGKALVLTFAVREDRIQLKHEETEISKVFQKEQQMWRQQSRELVGQLRLDL